MTVSVPGPSSPPVPATPLGPPLPSTDLLRMVATVGDASPSAGAHLPELFAALLASEGAPVADGKVRDAISAKGVKSAPGTAEPDKSDADDATAIPTSDPGIAFTLAALGLMPLVVMPSPVGHGAAPSSGEAPDETLPRTSASIPAVPTRALPSGATARTMTAPSPDQPDQAAMSPKLAQVASATTISPQPSLSEKGSPATPAMPVRAPVAGFPNAANVPAPEASIARPQEAIVKSPLRSLTNAAAPSNGSPRLEIAAADVMVAVAPSRPEAIGEPTATMSSVSPQPPGPEPQRQMTAFAIDTTYRASPLHARPLARPATGAKDEDALVPGPAQPAPTIGFDLRPGLDLRSTMLTAAHPREPNHVTHDFGAVIDRLVEARQAGATITSATLPHPAFGQVRLRLHEGANGMEIALSSPDPAFAPAAEIAIQTTAMVPTADLTPPSLPAPVAATEPRMPSARSQDASTDARRNDGSQPQADQGERRTSASARSARKRGSSQNPIGGIYA